ncbi:hypothetical protein PAHAL_5G223200 [Panicum hallii]|uniref:Uncharacterized protein n=1 Tax=Panicum hallii TaxID=206008 RepID=A0A2T8IKU9_9POAL|nr:hypothetical protein PAHAL_5G223200 [Panicum hallii]
MGQKRCLYSLLSFCSPIVTMWSTARSAEATYAFHGWFDLFASALGSFGWLLFAISQLHGEDGQIIGIAAVVVNAFGFAFYATYIVVKLAVAGYMGTKACLGVMLVFLGAYISAIIVSVYGPMKRESREAMIVSFVAFILQIISQSIPLFTVCPLLWSMIFPPQNEQRPEHINTRKLIVMTYEHVFFQLANDVGAVLSFVSMGLHLVYALRPHAVDYPPAPAPQPQPLAKV